jgi:hypothetical protein
MNRIVRGRPSEQPRYRTGQVELPPDYDNASFFSLQTGEQQSAGHDTVVAA